MLRPAAPSVSLLNFRALRHSFSKRFFAGWLTAIFIVLLTGCGMGPSAGGPGATALSYSGVVQGGQQPVTASLVQLYAVGTTGDGSAATPLVSTVVTTSDGTGNAANSNANAGNGFNSFPAGSFTITGSYTCPSPSAQVYLVATGGNPGLPAGSNNQALAMMAALGACGNLTPTTNVFIDELTTVGSIAPLAPYMNGYASLGSSPGNAAQLLSAMNLVRQYTNTATGTVPGPDLAPGYYASQVETTTLGDILAGCVNSAGTGDACTQLFRLTTPPGGSAPTDTIGAAINIVKYPANNAAAIFNLLPATAPFQPTLSSPPASWSLPIVPIAATPVISPAGGSYSVAPSVTITTASNGATIRYTTDGSTPTASSAVYTVPFTLSASGTVRAIAIGGGFATSAVASATYTLPPAGTATRLVFVTQPGNPAAGYTIPSVRVGIADAYGTVVPVSGVTLTVALAANPGSATLGGTKTAVTSQDGTITFGTLTVSAAGTGYTLTISAPGYASVTSAPFTVYPYGITLTQPTQVVGTGKTMSGKVSLGGAAPAGGTVVSLAITDTSIVTVSPDTITIPEGSTTGNYTISGVAPGQTLLTATAPNYASQSLTQYDSASFVSFGSIAAVTPGVTVTTTLSLSAPAPAAGLTVAVASSNTASATITPASVTFAAGATTSATTLSIVGKGYGSTDLSAAPASSTFGGETRTISTGTNSATLTATLAVPASGQANDTITLASPAPPGGINFALTSSPAGIVNIPSFVFVAAGATSATFTVTAAKVGTATITATGGGLTSTSTTATTTGALNYYANVTGVGLDYLTVVSTNNTPSSPITFTLTSSNPSVLLLASSNAGPGSASLTVSNVTVSAVNFYLRGVSAGTADVTISAPGYTSVTATTTVYRPAVKFYTAGCCGGNTTSGPLPTQMSIYLSNSTAGNAGDCLGSCTVSPGAGFSVNVASTDTNIVTVQSPVVFAVGATFATLTYTPVNAGTAKLQMTSTPPGYYDRTGLTYAATVNIGQSTFHSPGVSQFTTGAGVYITNSERLDYTPAQAVTVTVSTGNPAIAVISSSAATAGVQTLTFPNITGTIPTVYLQGLQAGTTTLTYSAPGVADLTTTVNVNPAGVVFYSVNPLTLNTANTLTGTLNVGLAIYNSSGSGVLQYCYLYSTVYCALNPTTGNATTLVSSDPAVGTISPSPLSLAATQTATATLTATGAGSATVTIAPQTAPLSNNTSAAVSQVSATVTSPTLTLSLPTSVGASVYSAASASLSPSPASAKTMTLAVTDPTIALLSTTSTALGSASISFTGITSNSKTYYIQGLQAGTTTVKISAPGYTDGTATLTVLPTGIVFATGTATFPTTAFATARTLTLYVALLNPTTGALQAYCSFNSCFVNPGSSLSIPVSSSNTSIGTISTSPVTFTAGTNTATTNFVPNDVGQTTLSLGNQPLGFSASTTAGTLSGVVTVSGDLIDVSPTITGEGVYTYKFLGLPSSPGSYPVTVTVALADQSLGRLSTSETTLGTSGSLTFTLNSGLSLGQIFIQGIAAGNTTLVVSARGYATGRAPVQVMKTGITFLSANAAGLDLNLSAGNQNGTTTGLISLLDPVSLAWISDCPTMIFACKVNPGHSTDVVFGTADSSVASFSTSPVSVNTSTGLTAPAPITVNGTGVTEFGVAQQPTGWVNTSTPYRSTGRIVVGDVTHLVSRDVDTAVGLQVQTAFTLSATNQASLSATFTATVADPTVAVLSTAFGTAGGTSVSAQGTGALGFTFYVQGKKAGTTTITFSGGGYTPRTVTVRVNAGGFVLKGPDMFRKLTNGNQSVLITPAVLNGSQQWIADAVTNPGSTVNIPVTSSDVSVGTIVTSPVALTGAVSGVNGLFHPVAVGTTVLSVGTPSGFTAPLTYSSINATVQ